MNNINAFHFTLKLRNESRAIGVGRVCLALVGLPVRRGGLRTRPQRWRVATAGWVALQAGG